MRTIDTTLKAELESGSYQPFFELQLKTDFAGSPEFTVTTITKYKLSPFGELELEGLFDSSTQDYGDGYYAVLRRGIVKDGIQYYLDSSDLTVETIKIDGYYIRIKASVVPATKLSIPGDDTYWNVIQDYCDQFSMSADRKESGHAYWDNQFLPTGKMITLNKAEQFRPMLKQKFFMNFTDAGDNTLLFFSAKNTGGAQEYTITTSLLVENTQRKVAGGNIGLLWRNSAGTIYQADQTSWGNLPLYNLGYIEDGDILPIPGSKTNANSALDFVKAQGPLPTPIKIPINLEYLTGDFVKIESSSTGLLAVGYLLVTEYFDPAQTPSWGLEISIWDYVANTEGGALPSTIERVAAYTPLVTSGFDGLLDVNDNNLQAAMDTLDDATVAAQIADATIDTAPEDTDKFGFWDSVTALLNAITWANIKATLKSHFDTIYASISTIWTQEQIEDLVGAMVTSNTETGISVTYDDTAGKLNFDAQAAGDARYAPIAKGVTNGDSHDHNGGDGAQIPTGGIADDAATNAKLANMAASTIKGRVTASTGDPEDLTAAQARAVLSVRELLTATRTYYVRTDGSNSNTGLANTSGGAFLTIQKAIDTVFGTLDLGGFDVTIQIADGTYTGTISLTSAQVGKGTVTVQGNNSTPANVVINTNGTAYTISGGGVVLVVKDMKVTTNTTAGQAFNVTAGAYLQYGNIDFGVSTAQHIFVGDLGIVKCLSSYSITGNASNHFTANGGSFRCQSVTVTLTGTPAFSSSFAATTRSGFAVTNGITFSGSATGTRYSATLNGVIDTGGGGANYFPGNAAGSTATGGQYA